MDCRGGCARAWQRKGIPVLLRAKEPALYQKRRADSEVGPYNYQRFGSMRTTEICWCAKGLRFGVEAWFDEKTGESPGGRTEGREATRRPNGPLRKAGPTTRLEYRSGSKNAG